MISISHIERTSWKRSVAFSENYGRSQSRNGVLVRLLGRIHDRMERALDRQNNFVRPELLATDICIPVHGSPC